MLSDEKFLAEIQAELDRVAASDVAVSLDEEFDPRAGTLVKVELDAAYWHLFPDRFHQLLQKLPDGAGGEAVRDSIETQEVFVWHGPSPPGSRDTSN